jgi:hypothetical protein
VNVLNQRVIRIRTAQLARRIAKKYPHRPLGSDQDLFRNYLKSAYGSIPSYGADKINILIVVHNTGRPTSSIFIRLISPLTRKIISNSIGLELTDTRSLIIPTNTDVCIVARTALSDIDQAKYLVSQLKKRKIKLIVDTDDAFSHLSKNHPQYELQKSNQEALGYIIDNCDNLWLSTDELVKVYEKNDNAVVIKNTLDLRLWSHVSNTQNDSKGRSKIIRMVYMGTVTHDNDFALILPALKHLNEKYPGKFTLTVIGISDKLPNEKWIELLEPIHPIYPEFVKWFSTLPQFDFGLAPLEDSKFNKSKSDIKCLDYLACGIRPIVSDVNSYKNPELNSYITRVKNTDADWFTALEYAILDETDSVAIAKGYKYIQNYRSADIVAQEIYNRLKDVTEGDLF